MIRVKLKKITALLLSGIMIASSLATPAYAIYSYYSMDALTDVDKAIKDWTWSADAYRHARSRGHQHGPCPEYAEHHHDA